MERFSVILPDDNKIVKKDKYIVNSIIPIAIRCIDNNRVVILFFAKQDNDGREILLQSMLKLEDRELDYFKAHPLNLDNLKNDKTRLAIYVEATQKASNKDLYVTDFIMDKHDDTLYFKAIASQQVDKDKANELEIYFTKENFIKVNLFFRRLSILDFFAEHVFIDNKLKKLNFINIDSIKFDGSATDIMSRIVCNHYTCKSGNDRYKFNYMSAKVIGGKLKHTIQADIYSSMYDNDFTITDMVLLSDTLYIVFEDRSSITNSYKDTKVLIIDKDLYTETNLVDFDNNYEKGE